TRREALDVFESFPISKTSVIPNYLDETRFFPQKKTGEAIYTLGIIGITPKIKRLDRAVDILRILLQKDERYVLRVKGQNPLSYNWIHNRADEIEYYEQIIRTINSNSLLRHRVIFDPHG